MAEATQLIRVRVLEPLSLALCWSLLGEISDFEKRVALY